MVRTTYKLIAARLRQIAHHEVRYKKHPLSYAKHGPLDTGSTLLVLKRNILLLADVLDPVGSIQPEMRDDAAETGPEQSREEVVGISTRGKSANLGNMGFSGGSIMRLATA